MPRMMRFERPGSLAHIMAKGIDKQEIFIDKEDRNEFLVRFTHCLAQCGYRCISWCLMPNHYHLFVRTSEFSMSALMRPLNGGYARWFNKKYKRRGYLFQDRYKSILCQDQEYARQLIRYIHLNPLRAGEVSSVAVLKNWEWCGHGYLIGVAGAAGDGFQDRNEALRRFGATPAEAVASYFNYIQEGIDNQRPELSGVLGEAECLELAGSHKGWPAVIGDSTFARSAMERHAVAIWRKHRKSDYREVLEKIATEVCRQFKIKEDFLFHKGRRNSISYAREQFCFRTYYEEKLPLSVIACFLGTTVTPVAFLARRGKEKSV